MRRFIIIIISIACFCSVLKSQNIEHIVKSLKTDRQKADTFFLLGLNNFRKARFDSAGWVLNIGLTFAKKTGDHELIARYIIQQSYTYLLTAKYEEGMMNLKKVSPHLKFVTSTGLNSKYFFLTGRFFEKLNHNDSALYYYHQCELLNDRNDPYQNFKVYAALALMFKRADAFGKSEKYFIKAYHLTKSKGIRKDHIQVLMDFADFYYVLGKPDKFAPLMEEQQKIMAEIKRPDTDRPSHMIDFISRKEEPLEKKVVFMEKVKQELVKGGHVSSAARSNTIIAGLYEKAGQPTSALKYIEENLSFFEKEKDIFSLYDNTKMAYRLMRKAGMLKEAIQVADKLFFLKDSIIALQQRGLVMNMEAKYETEKKEKDIILLNAEKELSALRLAKELNLKEVLITENILKDSEVNRQKDFNKLLAKENVLRETQLANEKELKAALLRENRLKRDQLAKEERVKWLLTCGGLLLILFGLTIFYLYRKQRSKNLLIQKQADDLQMLMREIHHRVKNNLQVISSLLDLQSLTIKDRHASEAIKESRNRVYSMALIHQNLYKDSDIVGIEMNDYINQLVQSLFQSYHSGESKIALETDIDSVVLDVDMVIPIGLVINELVSNSLKYAFKNSDAGVLHIGFKKLAGELLLTVKDNGAGFPKGMNVFKSSSFGYKLVKAFSQKLKARLEVFNDNGACIVLHIKKMNFS